jgi:hypothetical protein
MSEPNFQVSLRQSKRPNGTFQPPAAVVRVSEEAIAKRAYERFLSRGCVHGLDKEDWAVASRELVAEVTE